MPWQSAAARQASRAPNPSCLSQGTTSSSWARSAAAACSRALAATRSFAAARAAAAAMRLWRMNSTPNVHSAPYSLN